MCVNTYLLRERVSIVYFSLILWILPRGREGGDTDLTSIICKSLNLRAEELSGGPLNKIVEKRTGRDADHNHSR